MGAVVVRTFTCDQPGCQSHATLHPSDCGKAADALVARGWLVLHRDDNDPDSASLIVYCPGCKDMATKPAKVSVTEGSD